MFDRVLDVGQDALNAQPNRCLWEVRLNRVVNRHQTSSDPLIVFLEHNTAKQHSSILLGHCLPAPLAADMIPLRDRKSTASITGIHTTVKADRREGVEAV